MITSVNKAHTQTELALLQGDPRKAEEILYGALASATPEERPALERLQRSIDEMGQGTALS